MDGFASLAGRARSGGRGESLVSGAWKGLEGLSPESGRPAGSQRMSPLRPGREPAGGCGPESVDDTVKARGVASDLILLTGLGSGEDIEVSGWGEVGTVTRGGIGHSRGSTVRSVHRQWGPMETLHLKSDHVLTSSLWNLPPPPPPPPTHTCI